MSGNCGEGGGSGGKKVGGENFGAETGAEKSLGRGRGFVFVVHPQNGLNGLILNWCIGGCWFTPAHKLLGGMGPITLVPQCITSRGGLFGLPLGSNWKANFFCSSPNSAGRLFPLAFTAFHYPTLNWPILPCKKPSFAKPSTQRTICSYS